MNTSQDTRVLTAQIIKGLKDYAAAQRVAGHPTMNLSIAETTQVFTPRPKMKELRVPKRGWFIDLLSPNARMKLFVTSDGHGYILSPTVQSRQVTDVVLLSDYQLEHLDDDLRKEIFSLVA